VSNLRRKQIPPAPPTLKLGRPVADRSRPRRRIRFWHVVLVTAVALLIGLAALLGLMASDLSKSPAVALPTIRAAVHPKPPPEYASLPAPAGERIQVRYKLPVKSAILFDVRTGRLLWARQRTEVVPIASLTKMMTALLVVAHTRPTTKVLITKEAVHFTGSGVGLLPLGKRVPVLPLLYGLLLPSGNDAAIALAQHVAGTQDRFIAMMNERARQMGLACTHFTSVSGIVDQGNHSCATDLAGLAHAVLKQPLLARIVATRSAILPFPIKGGKLYLYNNNPLLLMGYPGIDGVKTGFTDAAGQCLVATARRGRTWLGVVLLHSTDTADQAVKLLNAGFAAERRRAR
jgi:serine-type D-Ala-D-Ala carboxypeptidase (penicillin-binding protein 5/6)